MGEARPWSGLEVEVQMRQVYEKLDEAVASLKTTAEDAATKKHAAKLAEAQGWMRAKADPDLKTEAVKKAWVYEKTEAQQLAADLADAQVMAARLAIVSMHHQADLLRTLARSNRDMHESPGWGNRS